MKSLAFVTVVLLFTVVGSAQRNKKFQKSIISPTVCTSVDEVCSANVTSATVTGHVTTAAGRGIKNARVTLVDGTGASKSTLTNSFGYFRFLGVTAGKTYSLTVTAKSYSFASRVVEVNESTVDISIRPLTKSPSSPTPTPTPNPTPTPSQTPTPAPTPPPAPNSPSVWANAGPDIVSYVGEPVRLNGGASSGYSYRSQANGTPSIVWDLGDGARTENILTAPHAYLSPGTYTATLTVKNTSGAQATDTVTVRVLPIVSASSQTVIDTGSPEINRQNLQAAINSAALNCEANEVRVPAGFVAYDPIIIPARNCTNYLTVRVADMSGLPENVRVTKADAAKLFKIIARPVSVSRYHQAIIINPDANYYRFIGLWVQRTGEFKNEVISVDTYSSIQPSHVIFDRILIDGNGTETNRAFAPNGRYFSLLNSSILDIKALGYESKAIGQWRGNGPLAVVNNRLEAASINSLVGGASVTSPDDVLNGFEFRSNYVWKSPDWVISDGVGKGYAVKNLFELKSGFNVSAVGNIFENNYSDGQAGEAILIKSAAQPEESNMYAEVQGVDFRNNKILNTRAGFNVVGVQSWVAPHPPHANHIFFTNNYWQEREGRGNLILSPDYFEINHNTFVGSVDKNMWVAVDLSTPEGVEPRRGVGLKILNSVTYNGIYGAIFSSYGGGIRAPDYGYADFEVRGNLFNGAIASNYPVGNYVDEATTQLGTDGLPVGANMAVIETETRTAVTGSVR